MIVYFDTPKQLDKLMSFFNGKKAVIILCIAMTQKTVDPLLKYGHPIIFFVHGVTEPYHTRFVSKVWKQCVSPKFDCLYLCGPPHREIVHLMGLKKDKYQVLPGLVQLDYLFMMKQNISLVREMVYKELDHNKNCKSVLIINQLKGGVPLEQVVHAIHAVYPTSHIYIKSKVAQGEINCSHIIKTRKLRCTAHSKISTISWTKLIYPYMCADIIIILGFSTCFIEALLLNPRTVMYMHRENFDARPPVGLLCTRKVHNIQKCLEMAKSRYVYSRKYLNVINGLMVSYFGQPQPCPVSQMIVQDMLTRFR
jgi:hypothetical protein